MAAAGGGAGGSAPDDDHVGQVLGIARKILSKPDLGADDDLMDHGGTSLSVARILTETSQALQLTINPRDLEGSVTARRLAQAAR